MATQNKAALRKFTLKSAGINSARNEQLNLAVLGDSWIQVASYWLADLTRLLRRENYTLAASGFVAATHSADNWLGATTATTGTWTINDTTAAAPALALATATSAAEWQVTLSQTHTAFRLIYEATGGVAEYSTNGGSTWTSTTLSGTGISFIDIAAPGATAFWLRRVSGTVTIAGVDCRSTRKGVIIHKLGKSGSDTARWATQTPAEMVKSFAALTIDTALIFLGTNDATVGRSAADFATNMNTIAARIRTAHPSDGVEPGPDIVFSPSPECYRPTPIDMGPYFNAVAANAVAQDAVVLDLQGIFGDPATRKGWFDTDAGGTVNGLHPVRSKSGLILAGKVYKELMA